MNPTEVAKQFLQFFYPTFGSNRAGVFGLYVTHTYTTTTIITKLYFS